MKLLLVEDDSSFGYIMKEYLEMNSFEVEWVKDGEEASKRISQKLFDLIILDVMLPKKDGFTLASEIKSIYPEMPVLFLTAKSLKVDKLKGYKVGCDDYITKPPDEELLVARIKAILNRAKFSKTLASESLYQLGLYTFNSANQLLTYQNDLNKIKLTPRETQVLKMLCDNMNQVVNRRKMLIEVWGSNDEFNRKSMDVFIFKLRKHLARDKRISISNFHSRGFMLQCDL